MQYAALRQPAASDMRCCCGREECNMQYIDYLTKQPSDKDAIIINGDRYTYGKLYALVQDARAHLPQIAAMADSHFEIEKHLQGIETITQIHVLKEHDSIRELARLLGGAEITPAVLENAKEMKELAQKQKNTRFK